MVNKFAYYNDVDPKACEWVRQLIKLGAIAPGFVDSRSIKDVQADDIRDFQQVHFFCGVAGWSYALRQAGWDDDRAVWTGSAPCQPFSQSGKQHGFSDKRHLWGEMFRLIRELQPKCVIGEQVASKIALEWFDSVANDLESENYATAAIDLSGGSAGAPHIRSRLFWIGHKLGDTTSDRQQWGRPTGTTQKRWQSESRSRGQLSQGSQRPSVTSSLDDTYSSVPAIGVDRVSSQGGVEVGRDSTAEDCSGASTSIPATFWDECEWIECRDGKQRPTGIGVNPLVGVPNLDRDYIRNQLERCSQRLFCEWDDPERGEKAQMFARLILETRNVGSVKSRASKMADGIPTSLVSSGDSSPLDYHNTQIARIMRLKGYGNAIVAPLATEFIRSIMELDL